MTNVERLENYINGGWRSSAATTFVEVLNPATADVLAQTPLSPPSEVDAAAQAAQKALESWRRTPATQRIQYLFQLKTLMEDHIEDLISDDHYRKR